MIIVDYILGAHYVPVCLKCFIRIVSFNRHINPGGGYYFILYLFNEDRLREDNKPSQGHAAARLHSFIYQLFIGCLPCVLEWQCAINKTKIPSLMKLTF